MALRYWVGGGSSTNWGATTPTNWSLTSGGAGDVAVPTTADDVFFNANSGSGETVIAAAANCLSATFTGFTGTITHNAFTWTIVKSLTMVPGMTYTALTLNASCKITFNDTAAGNTITTAGKILPAILMFGIGGAWTLQDSITAQTTTITSGTFNANNFNCSLLKISFGAAAIINMGSGTWTISGLTTSVIVNAATTLNANTSTLVLSNTGNTTKTISFGGKALYNLTLSANSGASHIYYFSTAVTVSNIFTINGQNHLQIAAGVAITASGTMTINSGSSTIVTIDSDTPGTPGLITGVSGTHNYNYLSITDNSISGGTYNAFLSTSGGGNSGWTISALAGFSDAVSCDLQDLSLEDILRGVLVYNGTSYGLRTTLV